MSARSRFSEGFTLAETLCAVAVIVVLLALAVPMLRRSTQRASSFDDLARVRATAGDFLAWGADHDGKLPNAGLGTDPSAAWFYGSDGLRYWANIYPSQTIGWPRVLERWAGGGRRHWQSALGPYDLGDQVDLSRYSEDALTTMPSRFGYSITLLTRHDAWLDERTLRFENWEAFSPYFKVVRVSDVSYPSGKGMLRHSPVPERPDEWIVGFVDGSASERLATESRPGAFNPMSRRTTRASAVHYTVRGHKGLDF